MPVLTGEANEGLFENMLRLAKDQELDVSFESKPEQDPSIKGMYYSKNIWVRPEESRAQQLKTIIHEMAHYYSENVFPDPAERCRNHRRECGFYYWRSFRL